MFFCVYIEVQTGEILLHDIKEHSNIEGLPLKGQRASMYGHAHNYTRLTEFINYISYSYGFETMF